MTPTRLSALDASFLDAETPTAHMHVGWAAVFEPPESRSRPGFAELSAHIAGRLDRAPRYRQRLAPVPLGLNEPEWVDDVDFDVARHVLPAPETSIDAIVARVMSTPLERSRPLWECWIAPELDDGRVGVVGKVHHSMVDGLAAVELAALLLDPDPDAAPDDAPRRDWTPAPLPGALDRLARGVLDRGLRELGVVRRPWRLLWAPARIPGALDDARSAAQSLVNSFAHPAQPTASLNPELSPLRHLAHFSRPMDDLVRVKAHFGTTINDVVLAACTGGARLFLEEHGEVPAALKAMVPVTMRGADEASGLGNRISFLFMELPSDEPDAVARLREIHATTAHCKDSGEAHGGDVVLSALGHVPHMVQRQVTKLVASPRTFNLVVSNIPGPPAPMWMLGCRLAEAYPVVPLADRHAVAVGMTTLPGRAFFGIYADRKMLPDAQLLADEIDASLDELLAACPPPDGSNGHGPRDRIPVGAHA